MTCQVSLDCSVVDKGLEALAQLWIGMEVVLFPERRVLLFPERGFLFRKQVDHLNCATSTAIPSRDKQGVNSNNSNNSRGYKNASAETAATSSYAAKPELDFVTFSEAWPPTTQRSNNNSSTAAAATTAAATTKAITAGIKENSFYYAFA